MNAPNRRFRRVRRNSAAAAVRPAVPSHACGNPAAPAPFKGPFARVSEQVHRSATADAPEPSSPILGAPEGHEAACASLRRTIATTQGVPSEHWQRILRTGRQIGWPEASVDQAWQDITGAWGTRFDNATGRGGQGAAFRARLPVVRRYHTELLFDLMMVHGVREPSMQVRIAVHRMRATASVLTDMARATELRDLAALFERYPDEAVDYAAEWATHFNKRMGYAR